MLSDQVDVRFINLQLNDLIGPIQKPWYNVTWSVPSGRLLSTVQREEYKRL